MYTYLCIHTYLSVYIHTYIHTYILHTHIHTYIHTYIHACIHAYVGCNIGELLYINAGCYVRVTHKQGGYEDVGITRECVLR